MACLHPLKILNKRYKVLSSEDVWDYMKTKIGMDYCISVDPKFNFHSLPRLPPDYFIEVPCGKCMNCRKNKRLGWSFRLIQEIEQYAESSFVTLTLDSKWLPVVEKDPKRYIKLYIDRLRKCLGFRPRYFLVSELGDKDHHTGRLHFHCIFFGTSKEKFSFATQRVKWPHGNVWTGYVNHKTALYLTKYMLKDKHGYKPFIMCSNGIGSSYITTSNILKHLNGFDFKMFVNSGRHFFPLSQYYTRKMFSEEILLVKMLNNYLNPATQWRLNGVVYDDYRKFLDARDSYYKFTLDFGLSTKIIYKKWHNM